MFAADWNDVADTLPTKREYGLPEYLQVFDIPLQKRYGNAFGNTQVDRIRGKSEVDLQKSLM